MVHELSDVLVAFVESQDAASDPDLQEQALRLADDVWAAAQPIPAVVGTSNGRDWLMEAINHPAGKVAEF